MSVPVDSDMTLLTEHLTYRPAALIDDIINSINILAFKATDAVEKGLLSANPADLGFHPSSERNPNSQQQEEGGEEDSAAAAQEKLKHEIENGVHQLETLLEAKIDKNFDKLELYTLRNILSVPADVREWVRLQHYEGLNFATDVAAVAGDAPTTESVTLQRRKLRETQKLNCLLLAETARNEATIAGLRSLLARPVVKDEPVDKDGVEQKPTQAPPPFAFLQDKGELTGDVVAPISTTTSFALSQLPALKTSLEGLRERLAELGRWDEKEGLVGQEEKSWRRERVEFVERETRRHLESVRGLELDELGAVRDGEWQGEGRKLANGEVEDLERVVGLLSGGHEGDAMDEGS